MKLATMVLLVLSVTVALPACSDGNHEATTIPKTTEFGQMLGFVPYSFLEDNDIWFGNLGKAKEMYGVEDVDSFEELMQLPEEQRKAFAAAWSETSAAFPMWNNQDVAPLTGFDVFSFRRILMLNDIPPRISYLAQGNFDEELIASKLTEQGYSKTDYGAYSYYGIGDDLELNLESPLGRIVLAGMNRLAVFDNILVISSVTEQVTGILDTMTGDTPSVMDNAACQALADNLGDVLTAVITTPQRIIYTAPNVGNMPTFDFAIPDNWGQLHQYDMAALGYRADGNKRFLDIALYYEDKEAAIADGEEIIKRTSSYTLNTWHENFENTAFNDLYQPNEPLVTQYAEGAVLKISCQLIPEERRGVSMLIGGDGTLLRDLLFLVSDPTPFIQE